MGCFPVPPVVTALHGSLFWDVLPLYRGLLRGPRMVRDRASAAKPEGSPPREQGQSPQGSAKQLGLRFADGATVRSRDQPSAPPVRGRASLLFTASVPPARCCPRPRGVRAPPGPSLLTYVYYRMMFASVN